MYRYQFTDLKEYGSLKRLCERYIGPWKEPKLGSSCNKNETYLVVIETKDSNGNVTAVSPIKTVVANSPKQAEQKAIVEMAQKGEEFKEGMEATARPFNQS